MKTRKGFRIISTLLCLALLLPLFVSAGWGEKAQAAGTIIASGYCGKQVKVNGVLQRDPQPNLSWTLDDGGTLRISGSGEMFSANSDYLSEGNISRNDAPWYSYRDSIKSVVIEDGVTTIGASAFFKCGNLESVTMPNSITIIYVSAFYECHSLSSVTPTGGTAVPGRASIPSSVSRLEYQSFYGCSSLEEVIIPGALEMIPQYTFSNCPLLRSVTIGSVDYLDGFEGCTALTELTIGSVSHINACAFRDTNLASICYGGTRSEWDAVEIDDLYNGNDVLYTAAIYCNGRWPVPAYQMDVPKGQYCIVVLDEEGKPISDAAVTWDGESKTTGSDGIATFDAFTLGEPLITVKKSGYRDWSNANSDWTKSDTRLETVVLYSLQSSPYKLKLARYSNFESMAGATDLLVRTKKLSLSSDAFGDLDFGKFYLKCATVNNSGVDRYELWQKGKFIAQCKNGDFGQLSVDDFSKGGCFVRVVATDGTIVDTKINLQFVENKVNKETGISILRDGIKITVNDDVPFLGGSTFTVGKLDLLPIEFKFSESKVYVGVNAKIWNSGDTPGQTKEKFASFKKSMEDVKKVASAASSGKLDSLLKEKPDFGLPGGSVKVNVIGYFEADIGSNTATGEIYFLIKAKTPTFGFTTWVVVVPVTAYINGYAELKAGLKVTYDFSTSTLNAESPFTITLGLDAFGGVGVGTVVGVGAYGNANVKFDMLRFTGKFLRSIDLTGELGVKAYVGPFTYQRPFAHKTWNIYTANSVGDGAKRSVQTGWEEEITDASAYTLQDLSYLSEESDWLGEATVMKRGAATGGAKTRFSELLTGTYRNAKPVMVSDGSALYAAFVRAEQESGSRYVAVTRYDGASWLAPVQADGEAILDDAPVLCVGEDGTIWLAYARTADDPGDSLLAYAQSQQIVVGTVDPDTLAFTEATVYSGSGFAHLQKLAVLDGQPVLMWADTELTDDDSVLSTVGGAIRYSVYASGAWSEAAALTELSGAVTDLTPGFVDGAISAAYIADGALYCASGATAELLAEENVGRVSFGRLPGAEEAEFFWNGDGVLLSSGSEAIAAEGITHEYTVVGSRIYYSVSTEESANLAVLQYTDGNWGLPMLLTGDSRYLENLSAASLNGTDYVFGMHTAVTIDETGVEDAKNLVWSTVMPVSDLRLDAVDYDMGDLTAGEYIPLTLNVINAGDHTVESVAVSLNGAVILTESLSLLPGESAELIIESALRCPAELRQYTLSVNEPGQEDYTPDDNEVKFDVGYADAELDLYCQEIGESKALAAEVSNRGIETASGIVVFYDENGEPLSSCRFGEVEAGGVTVVFCELNEDTPCWNGGDVSAVVTIDQDEYYTLNNSELINLSETDDLETVIVTFDANDNSGTTITQAVCANVPAKLAACAFSRVGYTFAGWNTEADGSGDAYADEAAVELDADLTLYAQWEMLVTAIRSVDNITVDGSPAIIASIYCTAMSATAFAARYGADGRFLGLETMVLESGDNEFTVLRQGAATVRFFLIDTVTWAPLCEPADAPQE